MTSTPTLTGIFSDEGECERCGRELGKVYEVRHPDGHTATYGRRCCAKITGYKGNLDKAAKQAARMAVTAARRAQVLALYPDATFADSTGYGNAITQIVVSDHLWASDAWKQAVSDRMASA